MTKSPRPAAWLLIAAASWASIQTANALSIPVPVDNLGLAIFGRADDSGCTTGFSTCSGFNLPTGFCCSTNSVCNVLAGNTTLLCCPAGQSCTVINPITCDISQQDPETHPEAPIKTSALRGVLTKCGSSTCCPFGYSCSSNNLCVMEENQNAAPFQIVPTATTSSTKSTTSTTSTTSTKSSSSSTSARGGGTQLTTTADSSVTVAVYTGTNTGTTPASATNTAGSTGTSSSAVNESAVATADDKPKSASTATIVGGVIGGLAGLLLLGAAIWFLCGRRFRKDRNGPSRNGSRLGSGMKQRDPMNFMAETNKLTRSTSSFGNIINNPLSISSPKPQGDATAFRTDFIRKLPSSGDYSRPVTPASSFGGGLGSGDAGSSTVGSAGLNSYSRQQSPAQQTQKGSPAPLGISLNRELPAPPSPSPQPLNLRSARDSFSVTPIRSMRTSVPRSQFQQQSKHNPREPSMEEINVGVDPSIIAAGDFTFTPPGTLLPPGRSGPNGYTLTVPQPAANPNPNRMTTFSDVLNAAKGSGMPNSVQSSPASRR